MGYGWLDLWKQFSMKFELQFSKFQTRKLIWKYSLQNGGYIVSASMC